MLRSRRFSDDDDPIALSFIDVISCGLGSAAILFLVFVTMPHIGESTPSPLAEAQIVGVNSESDDTPLCLPNCYPSSPVPIVQDLPVYVKIDLQTTSTVNIKDPCQSQDCIEFDRIVGNKRTILLRSESDLDFTFSLPASLVSTRQGLQSTVTFYTPEALVVKDSASNNDLSTEQGQLESIWQGSIVLKDDQAQDIDVFEVSGPSINLLDSFESGLKDKKVNKALGVSVTAPASLLEGPDTPTPGLVVIDLRGVPEDLKGEMKSLNENSDNYSIITRIQDFEGDELTTKVLLVESADVSQNGAIYLEFYNKNDPDTIYKVQVDLSD